MSRHKISRIESLWSAENTAIPAYNDYFRDPESFEFDLRLLFFKYMDSKNAPFAVADDIWDIAYQSFNMDIMGDEKAEDFDTLFKLNDKRYDREISGRLDPIFSNKVTCSFAVAWGMVYLYDFLNTYKFISEDTHNNALEIIDRIKVEIVNANVNELWQYNFILKWEKPDSMPDDGFNDEKMIFEYSFTRIIELGDPEDDEILEDDEQDMNEQIELIWEDILQQDDKTTD